MDRNPNRLKTDSPTLRIFDNYTAEQAKSLLEVFTSHLHEDIQIGTQKQLIKALNDEGFHISTEKFENNQYSPEFINEILQHPEELEAILLYCYNRNFWNTHIKDGNKLSDLRIHKPGDVHQDWMDIGKWKNFGKLGKGISKYGRKLNNFSKEHLGIGIQDAIDKYYQPHLLEMSPEEEKLLEDIILGLKKGEKNFIILNHDTFANIPLAILKFMKKAEELGVKNVNQHFTTIIGPLLNVHSLQNITLNTLSNVVITHPAGNKIPEAKPLISLQQKGALGRISSDLAEGGEGQVYFCAPSGTRDIVIYGKSLTGETVPHIYLPDESWGSNITSIKMVNRLKKNNPDLKVYSLSTNTTALKKDISLTDNTWNKGAEISMHLHDLNQEGPLEPKEVLKSLAEGVTYPLRGKENDEIIRDVQCATLIPEELFTRLKKWSKAGDYPQGLIKTNGEIDVYQLNELIKRGAY